MSVSLTEKDIKSYLDDCIDYWREQRKKDNEIARYYIDAFQSVRISLFDEAKKEEE